MIKKIYAITLLSLPTIVLPLTTIIACSNQNTNNQPGSGSNQPTTDFLEISQKQYEQSLKTLAQNAADQNDLINRVKALDDYDDSLKLGVKILKAEAQGSNQVLVEYQHFAPYLSFADSQDQTKLEAAIADLSQRQTLKNNIVLTLNSVQL